MMEIKPSYLVIILVAIGGIALLTVFVIVDLQSQLESEQSAKEQTQSQLEAEQSAKEQTQSQLEAEQSAKEQTQSQLEAERSAKEQKEQALKQKQIELEKQKEIERQQQAELERQQKEYEKELLEAKKREMETLAMTNPFISGMIKGTLNIYFEPVPSYASDGVSDIVKGQKDILDGYEIYPMRIKIVSNPNEADIIVKWIKDFGSPTLGHAIFKSVVEVGLGKNNCLGDWRPLNASTVHGILWHELGHSFGFSHSNDPNNIMYATLQTQFSMDIDKTITLDEGFFQTLPFCNQGTYSYSLSGSSDSNGFWIYVITPETDPLSFIQGDDGQYYSDCSGDEAYANYSNSCTVSKGASLLVYNRNDLLKFSAISVTIQVVDLNQMPSLDFIWDMDAFEYDFNELTEIYNLFH